MAHHVNDVTPSTENYTTPEDVTSSLAFFALGLAFLLRIRAAIRVPASRLTWLASGVGALALLCCGTLIPLPVMDSWLGGTNVISLLQNTLAAVAFWLVAQAVVTQGRIPIRLLPRWPLLAGLTAIIVPFFFIDRGATTADFMYDRAEQFPTFLYSAFYLAFVAWTCVDLFLKVWKNRSRAFAAIFIGAALSTLGTVLQLVTLGSLCFASGESQAIHAAYDIGVGSYTAGAFFIAANMVGMALMKMWKSRRVSRTIDSVEDIMRSNGVAAPPRLASLRKTPVDDLQHLYADVVAVNDHLHTEGASLSREEWKRLSAASDLVSERMFVGAQPLPVRYTEPSGAVLRRAARSAKSTVRV